MRAAVLGFPIVHSLSPVLHRAAYQYLGLTDWSYDAIEVDVAGLPAFLRHLGPDWAGLSLTMPLKEAALPLLTSLSPRALATRSVNTVVRRGDQFAGHNTDVAGVRLALDRLGCAAVEEAVVLGGGATARSVVAGLAGRAARVTAYVRSAARTEPLLAAAAAVSLPLEVRSWAGVRLESPLVVNTTPIGAADPLAARVPERPGALLEVLYDPSPTVLSAAWREAGGAVVEGRVMLVGQAIDQVALMTGSRFDRVEMLAVLERSLKIR